VLGALSAIGVPKNSMLRYATAIRADRFLLVVHGDASEVQRARDLLAATDVNTIDHHPASGETPAPAHA
jgi:hypothetical protein